MNLNFIKKDKKRSVLAVLFFISSSLFAQNVSFTATPLSGCAPLKVNFNNTSGSQAKFYEWYFGDGSDVDTAKNANHIFTNTGEYYVTLYAYYSNGNFLGEYSEIISVKGAGSDFYVSKDSICPGETVYFSYWGGIIDSLQWNFGDGLTSDQDWAEHTYNTLGTNQILLIVYSECGIDTLKKEVVVSNNVVPEVYFYTSSSYACPGDDVVFYAWGEYDSFVWDFGDGKMDSLNIEATHNFLNYGTYNVTLTATNSCGKSNSTTQQVLIDSTKVPDPPYFYFDKNIACPGEVIHFESYAGTVSGYLWDFGDGKTSSMQNPSHAFDVAGVYLVTLNVYNGCNASNSYSDSLIIDNSAIPQFYFDAVNYEACPGDSLIFYTDFEAVSYLWDFGDGSSSTVATSFLGMFIIKHAYANPGTFNVSLTVENQCGNSATDVVSVNIGAVGIPVDGGLFVDGLLNSPTLNSCSEYQFIAWGGVSYQWNFGDGNSSNESFPYHAYDSIGNYNVSVVVTNGCGLTETYSENITVLDGVEGGINIPAMDTTDKLLPCVNYTFEGYGGEAYSWNFGDGNTGTGSETAHAFDSAGTYYISVIITNECGNEETFTKKVVIQGACTSIEDVFAGNVLKIYPNPANNYVNLEYSLDRASLVSTEIYDLYGRRILNVSDAKLPGKHIRLINLQDLNVSEGIYIVRVKYDGSPVFQAKLPITRN